MNVIFSKCNEAIQNANTSKTYGFFYSENPDTNRDIHIHECCEILLCITGGKSFFIDERIYDVEDGDIFVINQFEAHKITSCHGSKFKRYVMQVHPSFLYNASTPQTDLAKCFNYRKGDFSHKYNLSKTETEKLENIFKKMQDNSEFGDDILKRIAAIEILIMVNNWFSQKNRQQSHNLDYENETLLLALKYINENFDKKLTLDSISKHCFVSANTLCNLFKTHIGTTVAKHIQSKRITEAKRLLKSGENVVITAEKTGFADYTSFIRSFKQIVGISPGKYQKQI